MSLRFFDFISTRLGIKTPSNSLSIAQASSHTFDVKNAINNASYDAHGRQRVSEKTTLFDGKILDQDDTVLWKNVGTGTFTFTNNAMVLSTTNAQYCIRQCNFLLPYFSGKAQSICFTMSNFQTQTNTTKSFGYMNSSNTAPYTANNDGFEIISALGTISLVVYNNGTTIATIDWTTWDNYSLISGYDFTNFTVFECDFLWLGGVHLRIFLQVPNVGLVLCHTYYHAGTTPSTIFKYPNLSPRFRMTGTAPSSGTFNAICVEVATEGSIDESGKPLSIYNTTSIACNAIGTIYALKSVKKQYALRHIPVRINSISSINTTVSDSGLLMLIRNPTVSAAITYANKDVIQEGTPTNQTITANTGRVLYALPIGGTGQSEKLDHSYLSWLTTGIDQTSNATMDEYVLAYMSTTATQSVNAIINLMIY